MKLQVVSIGELEYILLVESLSRISGRVKGEVIL
jgi:hypothetical protein